MSPIGAPALGSPGWSVSTSSARSNAMPWPIAVKSLMSALDAIPMSAARARASTRHGRFAARHSSSMAGHGTPTQARSGRALISAQKVRTMGASPG